MFNKFKDFIIEMFSFTSIFFTIYIIIEVIFQLINKGDSILINNLIFVFILGIVISIINYFIWYTELLKKCDYVIKRIIQYSIGLIIIYLCNDPTDLYRIIFIFIYYNIFYFSLYFIIMCKQRKDIEKLNKIIMKLKENKDE